MARSRSLGVLAVIWVLAPAALAALVAGCTSFGGALTPRACTGDPCAKMVCPDQMRCTISAACAPLCEALPYGH